MTSDDFKSFTKQILQDEDPLPSRPLSLYPSISLCCGLERVSVTPKSLSSI